MNMDEERGNEPKETMPLLRRRQNGRTASGDLTRRFRIDNDNGEHSLNLVLVVEDFRLAYLLGFVIIIGIGVILTKAFVTVDHHAMLRGVYGISNTCSYFDFPPSTYVLPIAWVFVAACGITYTVTAIFRIRIAYLENKLSFVEEVALIMAYVYVALTIVYFTEIFAVIPDPKTPVTMVIHTVPYINLKLGFCALQTAVVYFGVRVSWVDLNLPRWFRLASIIHVPVLIVVSIGNCSSPKYLLYIVRIISLSD